MSNYYLLIMVAFLSLSACKSVDNVTSKNNMNAQSAVDLSNGTCPENGSCSVETRTRTSFTVEKDGTGALYPKFTDSSASVIEFTYLKKGPEGTADGDYTEQIYFNVPNFRETVVFTDTELAKVNLLFNKQCFCRGEAGFYEVTKGTLKLHKNPDKSIGFELDFTVDETSHKISSVK